MTGWVSSLVLSIVARLVARRVRPTMSTTLGVFKPLLFELNRRATEAAVVQGLQVLASSLRTKCLRMTAPPGKVRPHRPIDTCPLAHAQVRQLNYMRHPHAAGDEGAAVSRWGSAQAITP